MLARRAGREKPIRPALGGWARWLGLGMRAGRPRSESGAMRCRLRPGGLRRASAQHAAGRIRDILEAVLLQDDGDLRPTPTLAARRDHRQVRADRGLIVSEAEVIPLPTAGRAGTD
jgi:hypothetical protein